MILDEKPPPPYISSNVPNRTALLRRHSASRLSLNILPSHILLQIVYATCPPNVTLEERTQSLYWMAECLRHVSRDLWIACMHVLRSSYLPLYAHRIIPPYTTDPFPATDTAPGSLRPSHRETEILDLYILIKVRQDMRAVESELYLDSEDEQYRDMFNLMQPRARVEDLVCQYGIRAGLISPSCTPFANISAVWGNRSVSLTRVDPNVRGRRRVIAETPRGQNTDLEAIARRLVRAWRALEG